MDRSGEWLDELRAATAQYPTISQLVIDEYQLTFGNSDVQFVCETAWILASPSGSTETLEADLSSRSPEAYRLCRIVGRTILSMSFDLDGSFRIALDRGDTLTLRKSTEGFESFNFHWKGGGHAIL
ncbi:MAG: hypothetical protein IT534_05160 [Bauldia sp.]|nr:hypothetical protein [Bauldia sp.]